MSVCGVSASVVEKRHELLVYGPRSDGVDCPSSVEKSECDGPFAFMLKWVALTLMLVLKLALLKLFSDVRALFSILSKPGSHGYYLKHKITDW